MAAKTTSLTVTGILMKCALRQEHEIDFNYTHRYSPNTSHYILFLDCAIETDDFQTVYFKTPVSPMHATNGGPCCVVTFPESKFDKETDSYVFPADHPWFTKKGTIAVATAGQPSDVTLVPKVVEGQRITIRGRIKAEKVSRFGKPYKVLSHVKKINSGD